MVKKRSFLSLIFVLCAFGFFQTMAPLCHAGMHRLSKIQDGIFHLRPKLVRSDTDKTDEYIDDEQAEQIAALSRTDPYTPADDDDYPYSLVDSLLLDTDLVIYYGIDSDCLFCAKTRYAYLSRNNYSPASFTGETKPPEIFSVRVRAREPFHNELVDALSTTVTNRRLYGDSNHTVRPNPAFGDNYSDRKYYTGEMEGGYVHVINACWSTWKHSQFNVTGWREPDFVEDWPQNGPEDR
ncbi:MAG: hypothetical protein GXP53_03500 [Deltaproteobacteria bacterium]|nr:hypothetical protein [Deltaproteobacteria bacterium]